MTTVIVISILQEEQEVFNQWKNLATKIVASIRKVDKNHMIMVECLNRSIDMKTGQQYYSNSFGTMNFFLLEDKNIAYEFHIYDPFEFTHQNASWINTLKDMFCNDPIRLQQGHSYEISGYVRGEDLSPSLVVRIRLDLYSCDSIYSRDKDYLKTVFEPYLKFGKENNVPLYLGECFLYAEKFLIIMQKELYGKSYQRLQINIKYRFQVIPFLFTMILNIKKQMLMLNCVPL